MAKNDAILLDGIIDKRLKEGLPSCERDEVFEFFVLEESLKNYDLSPEEIEFGWIDGRNDGGIDGFYIFINGHLLEDADEFVWPKSHALIEVWIFTCKHHPTFLQAPLDSILPTIQEIFDLSKEDHELQGKYSDSLLGFRSILNLAYRRLALGLPDLRFNVVYGSRGDTKKIGESVDARSNQIVSAVSELFSSCSVRFMFLGSTELVQSHRMTKSFSLDLPFSEHLSTGKNSFILLVGLHDYWKFVSDENGNLRRYLFDSNVRDYLGPNQVNEEISRSLKDKNAPDFWWLNNGVTILATNATVPGKMIQLQNIQIVNGLQTTETIFRHFQSGSSISQDRDLIVKIIVSSDTQARDQIIRATNNQSQVEIASLHATDKIQRDIEDILERHGWYYERRRNYYRNIGKPQIRFVTPLYLASAVVALIFKNPAKAVRLKSRFMRSQNRYDSVFSEKFPIGIWPILVHLFKEVEVGLGKLYLRERRGERFITTWRALISLLLVAKQLKTFSYSIEQLLQVDLTEITEKEVEEIWEVVEHIEKGQKHSLSRRYTLFRQCCDEAAIRYELQGKEVVGKHDIPLPLVKTEVSSMIPWADFVSKVDNLLPQQPWKQGVHTHIAAQLQCPANEVSKAIQELMNDGRRYIQRNGLIYDSKGEILTVDSTQNTAVSEN